MTRQIAVLYVERATIREVQCPKCGYFGGDDWSQCNGSCPIPGSPHYASNVGVGAARCVSCNGPLLHAEIFHYGNRCERCESRPYADEYGLKK